MSCPLCEMESRADTCLVCEAVCEPARLQIVRIGDITGPLCDRCDNCRVTTRFTADGQLVFRTFAEAVAEAEELGLR